MAHPNASKGGPYRKPNGECGHWMPDVGAPCVRSRGHRSQHRDARAEKRERDAQRASTAGAKMRELTEREIVFLAFGPDPEPECDGAGRDAYAAMVRERKERNRAASELS